MCRATKLWLASAYASNAHGAGYGPPHSFSACRPPIGESFSQSASSAPLPFTIAIHTSRQGLDQILDRSILELGQRIYLPAGDRQAVLDLL